MKHPEKSAKEHSLTEQERESTPPEFATDTAESRVAGSGVIVIDAAGDAAVVVSVEEEEGPSVNSEGDVVSAQVAEDEGNDEANADQGVVSQEDSTSEDARGGDAASEDSASDNFASETPEIDAVTAEEPVAEGQVAEDLVAEEPAIEAPVTEAPVAEDGAEAGSNDVVARAEVAPAPTKVAGDRYDDSTPLARELADITRRRRALAAQDLPLPSATRIFTVANQKGGVGKTTSTVNLAAALARTGARVLVIDLDPQGNASTALGVEHRSETASVYEVIIEDQPIASVVQKSPEFEALYCVPATIHLAGAEIELVSLVAREQRLSTALERFLDESEELYHYVFIDCPPSLGLLTINAFVAASEVLIPIQCEYYALEGLSQLLTNIKLIERHLNPSLTVSTILLTMYDARTNLANQVAQDVRDHFPDQVLSTLIPRSVRISEAPSYGQSVISYDTNSPGSLSYLEAAAEIARRGAPN